MRKTILIMTTSIDGYVAAPDGIAIGCLPEPVELKRWKLDRIRRAHGFRPKIVRCQSFWAFAVRSYMTYFGFARTWPSSRSADWVP